MHTNERVKRLILAVVVLCAINSVIINASNFPAISHTPCQNPTTKESGVCMFYWSCSHVAHGIHIASCLDRFLVGSCCKLPEKTGAFRRWFFNEGSYTATSAESELQEKNEIKPSMFSEISSQNFYEIQNKKTGSKEKDITYEIEKTTVSENYDLTNTKLSSVTSLQENANFNGLSPLAFRDVPKLLHLLRYPVVTEQSHDSRKPVIREPSHNLREPVMIEPSHDMRNQFPSQIQHENHSTSNGIWSETERLENFSSIDSVIAQTNDESMDVITEVSSNVSVDSFDPVLQLAHSPDLNYSSIYNSTFTQADLNYAMSLTFSSSSETSSSLPSNEHVGGDLLSSELREMKCGLSLKYPAARIVGGQNARYLKWPWMISLQHLEKNTYKHKCGAVLLNRIWAATVAHCVDRKLPSEVVLRIGDYNLDDEEEMYPHKEIRVYLIVMHPHFNPYTFENDLALLRFYHPVPYQVNIAPICLPSPFIHVNGKLTIVTGWGRLSEDGELPGYLQEAYIPVVSNKKCQEMFTEAGYPGNIPETFICAIHPHGGIDSCEGDSGGPMVMKGDYGEWILIGLISWGMECGSPRLPGVYTRVSQFVEWIHKFINI